MEARGLRDDEVVLAGEGEVRIVGSTLEAEHQLAAGFRPTVVLVGSRLCGPGVVEFASRLHADPASVGIPVLAVAGKGGWLRLTAVDEAAAAPAAAEATASLLQVLEDLCTDPPLPEPPRRRGRRDVPRAPRERPRRRSTWERWFGGLAGELELGSPDGSEG
jgi:hypothetical protein